MKKTLAVLSLLSLALVACQAPGGGDEGPIKIGYIGPLTGGAANYGKDTLHAVEIHVEEVNAAGGINGRQIEVVVEDGRCTGNDSASAAQKLIHVDNVVAIIGGQCSSETLAAALISEAAKIVQISPVSSNPDIADAGDFIFRVMPSDALKGVDMANYIEEEGYEKVAIITENTDYAVALGDALKNSLKKAEVVFDETVDPDTKDFRTLMARLKDIEHDVLVSNPQTDSVLAPMIQQYREQGMQQPIVSQDIADSLNLVQLAPEAVEGMHMFNVSNLLGEKAKGDEKPFAEKFREMHGEAQSNMSFATLAYDAAGVLFEAIGEVGTDSEAIRDYLYGLRGYDGSSGRFSFDDKGEVVGIRNVHKMFENGKIVELTD